MPRAMVDLPVSPSAAVMYRLRSMVPTRCLRRWRHRRRQRVGTMERSLYITAAEGDTGKSTIALGMVDLLSRTVRRLGVFRPVARSSDQRDYVLELLLAHDGVALTYCLLYTS